MIILSANKWGDGTGLSQPQSPLLSIWGSHSVIRTVAVTFPSIMVGLVTIGPLQSIL